MDEQVPGEWRAQLRLPGVGNRTLRVGHFSTVVGRCRIRVTRYPISMWSVISHIDTVISHVDTVNLRSSSISILTSSISMLSS